MNKIIATFCALIISSAAFCAEDTSSTKLKRIQPNWKSETIVTFPSGSPSVVLMLDEDKPVKEIRFSEEGYMASEADLIPSTDGKAPIHHGPTIVYYPCGTISEISFYDHGVLDGIVESSLPMAL